jgi:hypothetical protein
MFVIYCVKRKVPIIAPLLLALAAFLVFGAPRAMASPQFDDLASDGYVKTHWGPNEGLPSADTWPIIQSREGYVWIGTGFGLVRFDGMKFTPFNNKNYPVFRAPEVTAIHEDREGRIWVGLLSAGVLLYENGRFSPPGYCDTIADQSVTGIFSDSTGNVYLCTSAGVLKVRDGKAALLPDLPETPRLGFTASDGTVYVAGVGLVRLRGPAGPQKTVVPASRASSQITDTVLHRTARSAPGVRSTYPECYEFSEKGITDIFSARSGMDSYTSTEQRSHVHRDLEYSAGQGVRSMR